jgi:membrane protease YdiL (CAAX protease family)
VTDPTPEPAPPAVGADDAPDHGGDPPRRTWGLGDAALAFLVGMLAGSLTGGLYAAASGATTGPGVSIAGFVGFWMGLAGIPYLTSRRKGSGSLAVDFGLWLSLPVDFAGAVAGVAAQLVLVPIVVFAFDQIHHVDPSQQAEAITGGARGTSLLVLGLFIVVGVPIVEELFFRGLLLRALRNRVGDVGAIALSSAVFGLAHADPSLPGFTVLSLVVALGLVGAVFATLALRTGRLGPGIFAHAAFNLITVIYLFSH